MQVTPKPVFHILKGIICHVSSLVFMAVQKETDGRVTKAWLMSWKVISLCCNLKNGYLLKGTMKAELNHLRRSKSWGKSEVILMRLKKSQYEAKMKQYKTLPSDKPESCLCSAAASSCFFRPSELPLLAEFPRAPELGRLPSGVRCAKGFYFRRKECARRCSLLSLSSTPHCMSANFSPFS